MAVHGPWIKAVFDAYLTGKTLKAMLVGLTYVDDPDVAYRSSISTEVTGTGYTAGGVTLTGVTTSYDTATNTLKLDCADIDFGTLTINDPGGIVFYVSTGSAATDFIVAVDVFEPERQVEVTDSAFTYRPAVDGIVVATIGAP